MAQPYQNQQPGPGPSASAMLSNFVVPSFIAGTSATTRVSDENCDFRWTVEGFRLDVTRTEPFQAYFSSPSMRHTWRVTMTHTWDGQKLSLMFRVSLVALGDQVTRTDARTVTASAKIGVVNSANEVDFGMAVNGVHQSLNAVLVWRCGLYTPIECLMFFANEEDFRTKIFKDGKLRLACVMWIQGDQSTYATPPAPLPIMDEVAKRELRGRCKLSADFQALLNEGLMTDTSIICTGSQTFRVHKVVLAARSPVFAAMFQSLMSEAQKNEIKIQDFEAKTVDAMIRYIYYGSLSKDIWSAEILNLLRIADKYQLLHLKEECENGFEKELNVINVCEFSAVAHLYSQSKLMPIMVRFIDRNRDAVTAKEEFRVLLQENPDLLMNLYMSKPERGGNVYVS